MSAGHFLCGCLPRSGGSMRLPEREMSMMSRRMLRAILGTHVVLTVMVLPYFVAPAGAAMPSAGISVQCRGSPPPPPSTECSAVVADRPTGYWRRNAQSGTCAADSSGHGHVGTLAGGIALGVPGAHAGDPSTAMS